MNKVMTITLRTASTLVPLLAVAGLAKWNTWFHASLFGTLALAGVVFATPFWIVRRRQAGQSRRVRALHPSQVVGIGLRDAVTGLLIYGLGLFIAGRLPFRDAYFDRDLPQIEKTVKTLEDASQWKGAVQIIAARLTQRMSQGKRRELELRHVTDLTNGALVEAELEEAIAIATTYGIDASMPRARLVSLQGGRKRIDERLEWAKDVALSARKLAHLQETKDLSQSIGGYRLKEMDVLINTTKDGLRRSEPRTIEVGAKCELRVVETGPPATLVDLFVTGKNGAAIEGLEAKDISVWPQAKVYLATRHDRLEKKAQVYLALDTSTSVVGSIESHVRTGVIRLLEENPGWTVAVATFGDVVRPVTNWGEPIAATRDKLPGVRIEGRTALHEALAVAAVSLASRPEPRVLVLFTDGANTVQSKVSIDSTLETLKRSRTSVYCVALNTKALDKELLTRVSEKTGGRLIVSSSASDLYAAFAGLPKVIVSRSFYRLAIPTGDNIKHKVTIGKGAHALVFNIP